VTGLDTNVLARYLMQDDPRQSPRATRLIESLSAEAPGFVPVVTIVELVWVLSYYGMLWKRSKCTPRYAGE
jgi:predicted nucleic-acid-binding protein